MEVLTRVHTFDMQIFVLGKVYLKLGHGGYLEKPLNSPEEIANWYLGSVPNDWENELTELLKLRFPG